MHDRRDVSTPEGMGQLLFRLYRRSLPGFTDYSLLIKLMEETPLGQKRIKAGIPADATVAHKTGGHRTLAGVNIATNDAGIISLPGGNHIILVVFVKGSTCGYDEVERIIAEVTATITTAWLPE
jgi:beta-lactamase class A